MSSSRLRRLGTDYNKLQALAARSPFLNILGRQGDPPSEYTLQFTCKGVVRLDQGQPVYGEDHRVRITLGPSYPTAKPDLAWLTPIFHPNISLPNVCIGNEWSAGGRYLDDLVIFLMQMVRYDGENLAFSASYYNGDAYRWAIQNRNLLPVDKRPMFRASIADSIKVISESKAGDTTGLTIKILGNDNNTLDIRVQGRD